ncbi:hypothetical protein KXQ82_18825 [Mucilaginibacter sp. HMF5004]|uniref:hypothetical protein n=1 Tax=Mucilaginibacter rivuli TaxID=2857527 RepID=UPI001C5F8E9C|nr:hypothetical protein [Mucilaginibacter rivuli]MBW4891787.1 hypothetical protein [Mucilaginibacter rivuli]
MQTAPAEKQTRNSNSIATESLGRKGLTMPAVPAFQKQVAAPPPVQRKEDVEVIKGVPTGINTLPVQRQAIDVAIEGTEYGANADTLKTTGLGNCVAIIAYDAANQGAVMIHYNTMYAMDGEEYDPVSRKRAFKYKASEFDAVKATLAEKLTEKVPQANVRYTIAMGLEWSNVDQQTHTWKARHNLIIAMQTAFGVSPKLAAKTVTFTVANSSLVAS